MNFIDHPLYVDTYEEAITNAFGDMYIGIPNTIRDYYAYITNNDIEENHQKYFDTDMSYHWEISVEENERIDAILYARKGHQYNDELNMCLPFTRFYVYIRENGSTKDNIIRENNSLLNYVLSELQKYDKQAIIYESYLSNLCYNPG
jgi:hypothetical protein